MENIKKILKNKNFVISLGAFVVIIIGLVIFIVGSNGKSGFNVNDESNKNIEISNVKDGDVIEREIVVSNGDDKDAVYDLVWVKVTNKFKTQSDLLYSISSTGSGAVEVGTSQVPVADSPIMKDIKIAPDAVHKYKLKIWYEKSSKSKDNNVSAFKGYVKAVKHE